MKRLSIIVLILLLSVSILFAGATQPIENSLRKQATVGVWLNTYDYYQRTEDYSKLKSSVSFGVDPDEWGNTISFGASKSLGFGPAILMFKYTPDWEKTESARTEVGINKLQTTVDQNYDPELVDNDSQYILGLGAGIGDIGLFYAVNISESSTELEKLDNQDKNSNVFLYNEQDVTTITRTDTGSVTHFFEIGGTFGVFKPQLQIRLKSANGDNEDGNYSSVETTKYFGSVTNTSVTTKVSSVSKGASMIPDSASLMNNYSKIKYSQVEICPEVKWKVAKPLTLYLGGEIETRSLDADNARSEKKEVYETYYTGLADPNKGKLQTSSSTNDVIEYTQDKYSYIEIYTAFKYINNISDAVQFGMYPTLKYAADSKGYSSTYTRNVVSQNDANADGTFQATEITTTLFSGDINSFETTATTISLAVPLAIEWAVSKILSFRLASSVEAAYITTETIKNDIDNFTSQVQTVGTAAAVTTKQAAFSREDTETKNELKITSREIYYGVGLGLAENFDIDLLGNSTTDLAIHTYAVQATYIF